MVNSRGVQLDLAQQAGLSTERFPQSEEEADIAEDTMARELGRLSLAEHEKALFDIHGIAHVAEEDPATIERALKGLQEELEKIEDKDAYEAARFLNEQYVTNREFLLRFLRCEEFNTKASAETIVNHFNVKRELFGSGEILAREVRQSDLSAKELAFVKSGFIQLLPSLDISGRAVYVIICDLPYSDGSGVSCEEDKEDTGLSMRSCWYTQMSILDESSSAGAVWISYHYRAIPVEFQDFMRFYQVDLAIPLKCSGGHHCYTDSSLRADAAGFQLFLSEKERHRSKVHHGTAEEIHFKLQTFGLPMDVFPLKKDGTFDVSWHLEWLETLRKQEENNSARVKSITIPQNYDVFFGKNASHSCHNNSAYPPMVTGLQLQSSKHDRFRIREHMGNHEEVKFELQMFGIPTEDTPLLDDGTCSTDCEWAQSLSDQEEHDASLDVVVQRSFDILLGKTRRSLHHTGNRRLVHLCEMHFEEYCSANKHKKTEIADRLVTIVHESSGRFLNWTKYNGWVEVEGLVARNKVAHYFRYLRAKVVKKRAYISSSEETQSTDSSSSSDGSSIDNPESLTAVADSLAVSIQTKRAQKRKN